MRYAVARYKTYQREVAYRIYVTDCLRMMTENTARFVKGNYVAKRYADFLKNPARDNRTGEEIAAEVIQKAGLVVIKRESI
jgi:Zn-dependent membrane protease YugP